MTWKLPQLSKLPKLSRLLFRNNGGANSSPRFKQPVTLLSDKGLELRGRFDAWGTSGATVVSETGVIVGEGTNSDYVNFRKDGAASINGQAMEEGRLYQLADKGIGKLENGELTTITGQGYTIKQTSHDNAYINMSVSTGKHRVDNERPALDSINANRGAQPATDTWPLLDWIDTISLSTAAK